MATKIVKGRKPLNLVRFDDLPIGAFYYTEEGIKDECPNLHIKTANREGYVNCIRYHPIDEDWLAEVMFGYILVQQVDVEISVID